MKKIGKRMTIKDRKKYIYFAHSRMLYFTPEEELIEHILNMREYTVVNPRDFNMDEKEKKVTVFDFEKLKSCDDVLCLFLHRRCNSNIGTVSEMHWAIELNKNLIIISDFYHPFLDKLDAVYYIGIENFKNNIKFHEEEKNITEEEK